MYIFLDKDMCFSQAYTVNVYRVIQKDITNIVSKEGGGGGGGGGGSADARAVYSNNRNFPLLILSKGNLPALSHACSHVLSVL